MTVITSEDPLGEAGRVCREAYFAELDASFEGGFRPSAGPAPGDAGMRPPRGIFLVARQDGIPVGCGGLAPLGEGIAEVKRMWTAPAARGLGIARRLLAALETEARGAGYSVVRLDSNRALAAALRLYAREGYAPIARYNDNPYADFWFEKRLT